MVVSPILCLAYLCDLLEWGVRLAQPQESERPQEGLLSSTRQWAEIIVAQLD